MENREREMCFIPTPEKEFQKAIFDILSICGVSTFVIRNSRTYFLVEPEKLEVAERKLKEHSPSSTITKVSIAKRI